MEDKLQEGVAETITLLAQAGIKIWVRSTFQVLHLDLQWL